jgi:hypothetical protein
MSDKDAASHFQQPIEGEAPVLTGHVDGVITINLAEADDIARTQARVSYQEALNRHYEQGPPDNWQDQFVSTYATMHPWEDWAETWAHYLQFVDTLETQQSFSQRSGVVSEVIEEVNLPASVGFRVDRGENNFADIMDLWIDASVLLNSLNRSMGLPDPYPFVLHQPIQEKLRFIHQAIQRFSAVAAVE